MPTIKCLHDLFGSSPAVQTADLYVIDEARLAIEYRFRSHSGNVITDDLMLLALPSTNMTYDVVSRGKPQAEGFDAAFVFDLIESSKCRLSPVFDDSIPGPKPRAKWQHVDWPSLLPVPRPSPAPSKQN